MFLLALVPCKSHTKPSRFLHLPQIRVLSGDRLAIKGICARVVSTQINTQKLASVWDPIQLLPAACALASEKTPYPLGMLITDVNTLNTFQDA